MSSADDRTPDPVDPSSHPAEIAGQQATLEILFHSDLRRVGESLWPPLVPGHPPLGLGRERPFFARPGAVGSALPLLDPCVSREQCSVRWDGRMFHIKSSADARRPIRFLDAQGTAIHENSCSPDTLLAIGDRVLLRLRAGVFRGLPGLIGSSVAVERMAVAVQAAASRREVTLILGETGTGKELVARAVHTLSPRRDGPFVGVNCAALPENLAESELFGHVRGAFSGAVAARPGLFRSANGGTLFLDEVGELSASLQAKLLRVLELGVVRPVGSDTDIPVDVRIVAATHRSLEQGVDAGTFREDLLARLDRLRVEVPPLRERPADVPLLFAYHLQQLATPASEHEWLLRQATTSTPPVPLELVLELMKRPWPRNVREVQKIALAVVTQGAVTKRYVAPSLPALDPAPVAPPAVSEPAPAAVQVDAETLRRLLEEHEYVQHRVARALGVPYATLDRWLKRHGVVRPRDLEVTAIEAALKEAGSIPAAAARLHISEHGLRLRLAELKLTPPPRG